MRHKVLKLCLLVILILGKNSLSAQQAIVTTGDNLSGSGGSIAFTVGQAVYDSYQGDGGSVSQGIQQPHELILTTTSSPSDAGVGLKVHPNPVCNFLALDIKAFEESNYNYQLCDLAGRILEAEQVKESQTYLDMKKYVSAVYFLKIIKNEEIIQVTKIIKK